MIEQLTQLLQDASINRLQLNLSVKPNSNEVTVTINTFTGSTSTENNEVNRLREALSRPVVVRGDKGEVDVGLNTVINQYADAHTNAVKSFHSHASTISGLEQSTKAAQAKKPTATKKTEVPSKAVSLPEVTAPQAPSTDMFETGDVDSL